MNSEQQFEQSVQEYWEKPDTVSIIDKNLHVLEIDTVCRYLKPSDRMADIGCGNGEATVRYAQRVRTCDAFERSSTLRQQAQENIARSGLGNVTVRSGDVLDLDDMTNVYDVIVTQRVLINLSGWEKQQRALLNIHGALKTGGTYIMIENTSDAFLALNDMRAKVGLGPIPQHWHNRFFDYDQLMEFFRGRFQVLRVHDFGLYYFLTRVYSQMFASFTGYGKNAVKDPLFEKSDEAARIIYEQFADRIHIGGCRVLGPIQAFILRKEP